MKGAKMKAFMVVCLLVVGVSFSMAQSYAKFYQRPFVKTAYGSASFKVDTNFVWNPTAWQINPVTVTVSYDTTAGTTVGYFCQNDDSTHAIPLRPGVGGNYGDTFTFTTYKLKWYRIKGAVPVTVIVR